MVCFIKATGEGLTMAYTFLTQHPSIIACLVAYTLAPRASLRAWMAVQQLPAAEVDKEEQAKKLLAAKKMARICGAIVLVGFFAAEYFLITMGSEAVLSTFVVSCVSLVVFFSTLTTLVDLSGAAKAAAFRAPNGRAVWLNAPGSIVRPKMALVVLTSGAVTYASYYYPSPLISLVVSTTVAHRFVGRASLQNVTLRGIILVLLGWISSSMIISALMIVYLVKFTDSNTGEAPEETGPTLDPRADSFIQHIIPSLWAAGPGFLIAACFRFDYHQHLSRTAATETPLGVEFVDAPVKKCGFRAKLISRGVLVPNRAPTAFAKPYFHTALFSWIFTQLAVGGVFAFVTLPEEVLETNVFELATLLLCIPLLVISLLIAAKVRGEFKEFWTYKEVWGVKTTEITIKTADSEEEAVPAYQDVVKIPIEAEEVPPYQLVDVKA